MKDMLDLVSVDERVGSETSDELLSRAQDTGRCCPKTYIVGLCPLRHRRRFSLESSGRQWCRFLATGMPE
jgi:hypothetical protein